MTRVYASIGSNVDREANIRAGLQKLQAAFGALTISTIYENEAVGFDGDDFYNLVIGFATDRNVDEVVQVFRHIEDEAGRDRSQPKFSPRTLDIDILLYDDLVRNENGVQVPRDEITRYAFVLKPLAELCPDQKHPELSKTYQTLWDEFDSTGQELRAVEPIALS